MTIFDFIGFSLWFGMCVIQGIYDSYNWVMHKKLKPNIILINTLVWFWEDVEDNI